MIGSSFSIELLKQIEFSIQQRQLTGSPLIAAFDADGTLWDTDGGENFFKYQIENQLCQLPDDALSFYKRLKKLNNDPRTAYLWLAQICAGHSIHTVRQWAQQAMGRYKAAPLFNAQIELIQLLQKYNVQIFIITASTTWSIEPLAELFKIPRENVLGYETEVEMFKVTVHPLFRSPYKEGKAAALLERTNGVRPFLCSGNTLGDTQLLEIAEEFQIAIQAADPQTELGENEQCLQEIAQAKGWLRFHPKAKN